MSQTDTLTLGSMHGDAVCLEKVWLKLKLTSLWEWIPQHSMPFSVCNLKIPGAAFWRVGLYTKRAQSL